MQQLVKSGRIIFSIGMMALGALCFISKDFIIGRPPAWSAGATIYAVPVSIAGTVIIIAAIAILAKVKGRTAAFIIAALILLLSVTRHLFHFMNDWLNTYKSLALFGGALIVASSFPKTFPESNDTVVVKRHDDKVLIITGTILLALFFIASGYAHFKFADFVIGFIPEYIPLHPFFTYFCGVCLVAGGIGILIPGVNKWAALLSGIMLSGWFLLLHIPRFLVNTNDASDRMGLCESFAFAGIFYVLAGLLFSKQDNTSGKVK